MSLYAEETFIESDMTRSTHQKKLYSMKELFDEYPIAFQFLLTPTSQRKLLHQAKILQITESFLAEAIIRTGLDVAIAYYKEKGFNPKENKRFKSLNRYGENKFKPHKSLSLTETSSEALTKYALLLGESRSEILECALRSGAIVKGTELIKSLISSY